jgi:hypothetical protein
MVKAATKACGVMVVGLVLASSVTPSSAIVTEAQRAACTPDVFRLCSSEIPSIERIVACLQREKSHLSEGCRAVFNSLAPTETARRSRSLAESQDSTDWCMFTDGTLEPGLQPWKSWCPSSPTRP